MIKPTIGRVVWFWQFAGQEQPYTGLVCYVHSDAMVNLAVFDANGNPQSKTSVPLYDGEGERPTAYFAEWMPYQKGQAAKTEQLEKDRDSARPTIEQLEKILNSESDKPVTVNPDGSITA